MDSFNHPGGRYVPGSSTCNKIHCAWIRDSYSHRGKASSDSSLRSALTSRGATVVGEMEGYLTCSGVSTAPTTTTTTLSCGRSDCNNNGNGYASGSSCACTCDSN